MSTPYTPNYEELLSLWSIQDSLLQQYRTIFITMQSIFVGLALALAQKPHDAFSLTVLFLLSMVTLWLWLDICTMRGKAVYVTQYFARVYEDGEDVERPLKRLKDFQSGSLKITDERYLALLKGTPRLKMEKLLPAIFLGVWLVLWLHVDRRDYHILQSALALS